jgi:cytochrome c oxidase subunit 2
MRGQVIALSPADFERWLAGGPAATPAFAREAAARTERGFEEPAPTMPMRGQRAAAENGCLRCHTLDGTAFIGPTWAGLYMSVVPLADGGEIVADEAYITEAIMDPLARLHRGFDPVMPSYRGLITPPDIAAMVELIKSLRGMARDPVEPATPGVDGGVPPAKGDLR